MDAKMIFLSKKSQITIFVIIAILIVSAITLFFIFRESIIPGLPSSSEKNPEASMQDCIKNSVQETTDILSKQGGQINTQLYLDFEDEKISFLCYTNNYYVPCVNQEPMLIQHLKEEIKNKINGKVEECFNKFRDNLKNAGYSVDAVYRGFNVELVPKKIVVEIDADITMTRSGESSRQKDFTIIFPSRIYELAVVAQEIVSQEAKFCNFETVGFMLLYPEFKIEKFSTGTLNTIYTITDRKTNQKFKFAVRGCVIPPGF